MLSLTPASLGFQISNVEKLTLTSTALYTASGVNVGIGTSSPGAMLDITAASGGYANLFLKQTGVVTWALENTATSGLFKIIEAGVATRLTLDTSGNLGLGVTPSAWNSSDKAFQYGSNSAIWNQGSSYNIVGQNWYHSATGDFRITTGYATRYFQGLGNHFWDIAGTANAGTSISATTAMTLDTSGNLLVGTTNTVIWNTTNTGVVIGGSSASAIQVSRSGDASLLLNRTSSDGDIAIFARQGAAVGGISVNTSSTSFNTSSDYRLKENIVPMTGALATVAQLKPVTYKWKSNGSDGQGFIAHELAEVMPDCVTGEKDGLDKDGNPKYQGVDTSFLVATLVSAIQELKAEFDAYKATHP
jgi:hypothetical protein